MDSSNTTQEIDKLTIGVIADQIGLKALELSENNFALAVAAMIQAAATSAAAVSLSKDTLLASVTKVYDHALIYIHARKPETESPTQ